jgi:hypothetical protein
VIADVVYAYYGRETSVATMVSVHLGVVCLHFIVR